MISPPLSTARRRLRRPSRAILFAFVVLFATVTGLAAPATGLAQELDSVAAGEQAIDGGVAVAAELQASLEDAVEAGGAPVMPEAPPEPVPAPAPSAGPALEPLVDAPPVPDTGALPETAPAPAPESQPSDAPEERDPAAPVLPGNINIDIRILSPGDNGDVTQDVSVPGWSGQDGGAREGQPLDWEWNWNWTWIWVLPPPQGDDIPGMGGGLPEGVLDAPGLPLTEAPADHAAGMPPVEAEPLTSADRPPPARRDPPPRGRAEPYSPRMVADSSPRMAADSTGGAASIAPAVARATHGPRQPNRGHVPAPEQAPTVLPSAAASSLSGGSSAPLVFALLGLLCLLAPRALELARSPDRKLSSLLSSSRLERPG